MTAIEELAELRQQVQRLIEENERLREAAMTHDAQVAAVAKLLSSRESEAEKLRARVAELERDCDLLSMRFRVASDYGKQVETERNIALIELENAEKSTSKIKAEAVREFIDEINRVNQIEGGESNGEASNG